MPDIEKEDIRSMMFDVAVMCASPMFFPGMRAATAEEAAALCRGPAQPGDEIIVTPSGGGAPESFEVFTAAKGRVRVRRMIGDSYE